jgi:hypothetical protein
MKPTQQRYQILTLMLLIQVSRIASFSSSALLKSCGCRHPALQLQTSSISSSSSSITNSKYTRTLFDLDLPEGRCVGVELNDGDDEEYCLENWSDASHWVHECLHPDEVEYGLGRTRAVRKSFLMGRLAMRATVEHHHQQTSVSPKQQYDHQPCLKDHHGRPMLPDGLSGSISHKGNVGVALSAPSIEFRAVGIDIERHSSNKRSIASKVLTEREIRELGQLEVRSVLCSLSDGLHKYAETAKAL